MTSNPQYEWWQRQRATTAATTLYDRGGLDGLTMTAPLQLITLEHYQSFFVVIYVLPQVLVLNSDPHFSARQITTAASWDFRPKSI